jgi:hypothetical protein
MDPRVTIVAEVLKERTVLSPVLSSGIAAITGCKSYTRGHERGLPRPGRSESTSPRPRRPRRWRRGGDHTRGARPPLSCRRVRCPGCRAGPLAAPGGLRRDP